MTPLQILPPSYDEGGLVYKVLPSFTDSLPATSFPVATMDGLEPS